MTSTPEEFRDHLKKVHKQLVRDILQFPDWKFGLMNPSSREGIMAERKKWLKTKKGKRVLALLAEYKELIEA